MYVFLLLPSTLLASLSVTGCSRNVDHVTLSSCLSGLTNVLGFAQSPIGTARKITSYDRTGGNEDWSKLTNRRQDGLAEIAALKGPGAVHRFWATGFNPNQVFSFFFDGEAVPRIQMKYLDIFGKGTPFHPPLCDYVSGGCYSYMPLPFAKSLEIAVSITTNVSPRAYYQINYELFDNSVSVESFPQVMSDAEKEQLASVQTAWQRLGLQTEPLLLACNTSTVVTLQPGETRNGLLHSGPGTCQTLAVKLTPPANMPYRLRAQLLRGIVLRIFWDNQPEPSVETPLGDFFANDIHERQFSSLPILRTNDLYVTRFPMPFKKSMRAEVRNDCFFPVQLTMAGNIDKQAPPAKKTRYFHASWASTIGNGQPHRIVDIKGKGHYVGCYLTVVGTDGAWNILEGDERMWIDGEKRPSFHGTGLEDYFNGGWYYSGLFDLPLHGLLWKAPIRTSQYRFHLTDRIPFKKAFRADIEFGHGNTSRGYMSSVAYWYQSRPVAAGSRIPILQARLPSPDPLDRVGVMSSLFELERIGRFDEAFVRCKEYAETYPKTAEAQMLHLRALAYREKTEGFAAVQDSYRDYANRKPPTALSQQAKTLLWLHEAPRNMLLAAHINGNYKLYLDEALVGEGNNCFALQVHPIVMSPGSHRLALEVTPTRPEPWVNVSLKTATSETAIAYQDGWAYSFEQPSAWPKTDATDKIWTAIENARGMLPKQSYWQFVPDAYINTSSLMHFNHGLSFGRYWQGQKIWFRHDFDIP